MRGSPKNLKRIEVQLMDKHFPGTQLCGKGSDYLTCVIQIFQRIFFFAKNNFEVVWVF